MNHRTTSLRRALAALLIISTASCASLFGGSKRSASRAPANGSTVESSESPTRRTSVRPPAVSANGTPGATAPVVVDPAAPIAAEDYATTLSDRRTTLIERGLRLGAGDVGYYMDVQEARLRQLGGPDLRVTRRERGLMLELPGPLTFEIGSARLSASARTALTGVARVLVDYRFTVISIDGHTDDSGDATVNRALSEQRATAVAKHLIAEGVEPQRLIVVGRGSERPIADNGTEIGREANRRVVLRVDPLQR